MTKVMIALVVVQFTVLFGVLHKQAEQIADIKYQLDYSTLRICRDVSWIEQGKARDPAIVKGDICPPPLRNPWPTR